MRRGWITESNRPPPKEPEETPHIVDIPLGNKLADWLANNRDGTINVPAGESLDAGGVRFTCFSNGDDCSLTVTLVEDSINVTSAGGMATATLVPPPPKTTRSGGPPPTQQSRQTIPRRNGSFDMSGVLHGLNYALLPVFENGRIIQKKLVAKPPVENVLPVPDFSVFRIQDGKTKDYGRVRFSCRGAGCEVLVLNTFERGFNVYYRGNVTATLLFDTTKMWNGIWTRETYCLNDFPDDCTLVAPNLFSRSPRRKEIVLKRGLGYILTEDRKTQIATNYGWQGKRYVNKSDGNPTGDETSVEMVIYTNADGPDAKDYLSYGRSMAIIGDGSSWDMDGVYAKSSESTYGLGQLRGKVTYRGGATGWYAFEDTEAGHFTARATLKADLGTALEISGTIDRFVDEEGRSRNWKVDLESNNFSDRDSAEFDSTTNTVWTINGTPSDASRRWEGRAANEGNSIHGSFQADYGTEGRLNGAFGAEMERR